MLTLSILLFLSFFVNTVLVWYLFGTTKRLLLVSNNISDLVSVVFNYRNHLKTVYELEAFYGEPTLETLLKHSVALSEVLEEFEDIYSLSVDEEEQEEEENFDDDESVTSEEEAPQAQKIPSKTVFY
jgi:hypothetical protein|tara:strand:- start:1589 stop:1969 length:381 start_codon:yes stop_codon:yes gene_type:complete